VPRRLINFTDNAGTKEVLDAEGHELIVSLLPGPIFLDADLTPLAQVFGNLLTSSERRTQRGGGGWLWRCYWTGEWASSKKDVWRLEGLLSALPPALRRR
jgi:hypothetical protein